MRHITDDDALEIKKWAQEVENIVIVGAGFIGLETAATFSELGLNVTVIELSACRVTFQYVGMGHPFEYDVGNLRLLEGRDYDQGLAFRDEVGDKAIV